MKRANGWLLIALLALMVATDAAFLWRIHKADQRAKYLEDYIWVLENRIAATNAAVDVAYESLAADRKWLLAEIDKKSAK